MRRFTKKKATQMLKRLAATILLAGSAQAHAQTGAQSPATLNVAIASNAVIYGPVWVALADHLFEKNGVQVKIISTNALSTSSAMLVSGSADLVVNTAFLGLRIATEGKSLVYIMNLSNMSMRVNALIAKPGVQTVEELAAKGEACRVISLTAGTATYAIWQGIAARYNIRCAVSSAGSSPLVLAGALSGQFDAGMVNPQDAYGARDADKANIILDPLTISDDLARQIYPYHHPLSVVMGLRPNLEAKREAVVRFVRALRQADVELATKSPEQLGQLTKTLPEVFGSTPTAALALQYRIQESLFPRGPDAGFISAADWNALVKAAPLLWGFANLNSNDPSLRYETVVDMSFFQAAAK